VRVLGSLLADASSGIEGGGGPVSGSPALPPELAEQAAVVADAIAPGVPRTVIMRGLIAWTQLFGMISFELFGQFTGSFDPAQVFFAHAVEQMADFIGLPAGESR
jgi:hypothetical protein